MNPDRQKRLGKNLFILAGNGSYLNRGCEAIVRGTVEIIRRYFDQPKFIVCSQFHSRHDLELQQNSEYDPDIEHVKMDFLPQFEGRLLNRILWLFYKRIPRYRREFMYKNILRHIPNALAILSVGGDNYSLDYGTLLNWTDLDDLVGSKNGKLIIWGASVGPFDHSPKVERFMAGHLKRQTAILVRESKTLEYLSRLSVTDNVHGVADPAFAMEKRKPRDVKPGLNLSETIGINLSPMLAKYACEGSQDRWFHLACEIVEAVQKTFHRPILLIPHVTGDNNDDHSLLRKISDHLNQTQIAALPDRYNAAEIKWFISQCLVFAGARTHSTIAGFSSGVPTLSFSYSIKSDGLNEDIYGDRTYCLKARDLTPEVVCVALSKLIENEAGIRKMLKSKVPNFMEKAYESGAILSQLCPDSNRSPLC